MKEKVIVRIHVYPGTNQVTQRIVVFVNDAQKAEHLVRNHDATKFRNDLCEFWAEHADQVTADPLQFGSWTPIARVGF